MILATLPSLGQVKESGGPVIPDKMGIPRYDPLAAMAGVSAEVTLRLQVKKNGDVISVNVVGANADCGFVSIALIVFTPGRTRRAPAFVSCRLRRLVL